MRTVILFSAFLIASCINSEQAKKPPIWSIVMIAVFAVAFDFVDATRKKDK